MRAPDGGTQRILICEGDDAIWAGTRPTVTKNFPKYLPMDKEKGYEILLQAFLGKHKGLSLHELTAGKKTTQVAKDFLSREKAKSQRQKKGVTRIIRKK